MSLPVEVTNTPAAPTPTYSSSAIALYGVVLVQFQAPNNCHVGITVTPPMRYDTALIYGFSYQGHCYSLPEPVALLIETAKRQAAVKGCGYTDADYKMWIVEKLDETVMIQVTGDTFEEVVLKRNLGGAKPSVSYHSAMQVAHRGGKLTD